MSNDPVSVLLNQLDHIKEGTKTVVADTVTKISETSVAQKLAENEHLRKVGSVLLTTFAPGGSHSSSSSSSSGPLSSIGSSTMSKNSNSGFITALWNSLYDWMLRHKVVGSLLAVSALGGTAYYMYRLNMGYVQGPRILKIFKKKRLARKAANGGRIEVVVIAGSPVEPLVRNIASDLSNRGFIIYCTTSSAEEEEIVYREGSDDIRPLPIAAHDQSSIRASIKELANVLNVPATAFPGAIPHMLQLSGVIVVPDMFYPTGPIESIDVGMWSELLSSKILGPIFLLSNGLLDLVRSHQSRILLVSPSIMGHLNPGFHGAEGIVTSALESFSLSISRELAPQKIPFVHVQMGSFDSPHSGSTASSKNQQQERLVLKQVRDDILSWPDHIRALYARQYQSLSALQVEARSNASPMRYLNYTVYDALTDRKPKRVYYTGKGAYTYQFWPKYFSEGFVEWLLHPKPPTATLHLEKVWEPF